MARPRLDLNPDTIESLAAINCTVDEIASVMNCDKRTLERRYAANIQKGREHGKSSLRRMMWDKCKTGNTTMMIWLSKQLLGYRDHNETKIEHQVTSAPQGDIFGKVFQNPELRDMALKLAEGIQKMEKENHEQSNP